MGGWRVTYDISYTLMPNTLISAKQEMIRSNDVVTDCEKHQSGSIVHAQFRHDILAMGCNGMRTQEKTICDFFIGESFCNKTDNFPFTRRDSDSRTNVF